VVVIVVVLVLMNWRIPTRVQVELTADRAVLTVGGADATPVLNAVAFQSLTVEKFARIVFRPMTFEVADPAQYIPAEDRYPESAWTALTVAPPVEITGEDDTLQPAFTFEGANVGAQASGRLDRVWARPGAEVTAELRGTQRAELTIKIDRQESFAALSFREPFQLMTTYGRVSGISGLPYRANSLTYRAQLPTHSPVIDITGRPQMLVLILTMADHKALDLFSTGGIAVTDLDFTRQNPIGEPETALVKDGEITYPDYPDVKKVSFKPPDFLSLARLQKFRIEEIALDPEQQGMRLRLQGIARHVKTGPQAFPKDHRLTRFDTLWQNPRLMVLFGIVVWVFPTTVGGYRLYKELKGPPV
jgi:hypothetical protein